MVVSRVGNGGADRLALKELNELAEKGITDDELESVVSEYQEEETIKIDAQARYRMKKEAFKREKTADAFEEGTGGFKRST